MTDISLSSPSSVTLTASLTKPAPRMQMPDRSTLIQIPLDELIPPDHIARHIWNIVQEVLDLQPLLESIKAREGHPGRTPIAARIAPRPRAGARGASPARHRVSA